MSGGSQHNPNGRQSQIGSGWSPLQLQMASYLARAPAAHLSSERGAAHAHAHAHAWHTPTPPHLYHAPADPPDPLQAMKASATGNSVFRHTATPPDLYRHTPTPPDKHSLLRHTPSPGDVKAARDPADLFPHLPASRDKLPRPEDMLSYPRGVDLSLSRAPGGGAGVAVGGAAGAANGGPLSLSVRDAPTINSLLARAAPRPHPHARLDSLLERLAPSPPQHAHAHTAHAQPPAPAHSVIVHGRAGRTPSPPSSEDSADSGAGGKRRRKPAATARLPPPPAAALPAAPDAVVPPAAAAAAPALQPARDSETVVSRLEPATQPPPAPVLENGELHAQHNGPARPEQAGPPAAPHTRRKTRAGSETIDDIAAVVAGADRPDPEPADGEPAEPAEPAAAVTVDKLKSVLASPERTPAPASPGAEAPPVETAAAPKRRRTRTNHEESCGVPARAPSETRPAEPEASSAAPPAPVPPPAPAPPPAPVSIVDVENQLEMMFAGIEEPREERSEARRKKETARRPKASRGKKRRKSAAATAAVSKPERATARGAGRGAGGAGRGAGSAGAARRECDSGSNASSQGKARGPYIQIRGPRESPTSVSVVNSAVCAEEGAAGAGPAAGAEAGGSGAGAGGGWRRGHARGLHASTLGLRYDATTPDTTWVCVFCERGPHWGAGDGGGGAAPHRPLGDLFGPYSARTDCAEFRALPADERRRHAASGTEAEVWLHLECALWAPGLAACGARVWGLRRAVWACRAAACALCGARGAVLACARRGCDAAAHLPCAARAGWRLDAQQLRAHCAAHAHAAAPEPA